ncbi:hypothetical protein H2248_004192 [Termitomyces sp. 'cryptogamus']|nr:hypothetical protein H2248_004192 [Termitomyces sp. 'cryptogamus']
MLPDDGSDDELTWEFQKRFALDEETMEDLGMDTKLEELDNDQDWDDKDLTEKFIEIAQQLEDDPDDEN